MALGLRPPLSSHSTPISRLFWSFILPQNVHQKNELRNAFLKEKNKWRERERNFNSWTREKDERLSRGNFSTVEFPSYYPSFLHNFSVWPLRPKNGRKMSKNYFRLFSAFKNNRRGRPADGALTRWCCVFHL